MKQAIIRFEKAHFEASETDVTQSATSQRQVRRGGGQHGRRLFADQQTVESWREVARGPYGSHSMAFQRRVKRSLRCMNIQWRRRGSWRVLPSWIVGQSLGRGYRRANICTNIRLTWRHREFRRWAPFASAGYDCFFFNSS